MTMPGDIFGCQNWGQSGLRASSGYMLEMLLNIMHRAASHNKESSLIKLYIIIYNIYKLYILLNILKCIRFYIYLNTCAKKLQMLSKVEQLFYNKKNKQ